MRTDFERRNAGFMLLGLLVLAISSAPARAENGGEAVAIGSNLGVSYIKPDQGDGVTLLAVPNGPNLVGTSPGFRVAGISSGRGFEFGIDLGLLYGNSGGSSFHDVNVGLDAALITDARSDTAPYVEAEVGLRNLDFFGSGSQPYLGAGLGVRHIVASDNGAVKFGVGFRHFFENTTDGLLSLNVIDIKFGFDLWIPR